MKKLMINMRTPQTFYQELVIPFVIVILFVAIGQADFLTSYPGLDMTPEATINKGYCITMISILRYNVQL